MNRMLPSRNARHADNSVCRIVGITFSVQLAVFFLVSCVLVFVSTSSGSSGTENAKTVLMKCVEAQSVLDRVSMKVVGDVQLDYPGDRSKKQQSVILMQRDGDQFDIKGQHLYLDKYQENSYAFRYTLNKTFFLEYRSDVAKKGPKKGMVAKKSRADVSSSVFGTPIHGSPIDGVLNGSGGKRITENLLDTADVQIRGQELIGGVRCDVVEGHTRYGKATVWIAPDKGYCCLKFIMDRTGNDLLGDKSIAQQAPLSPSGKTSDMRSITRCLSVLDEVRVEEIEGHFVPVEARFNVSIFRQGGSTVSDHYRFLRTDITLNPKLDPADTFASDFTKDAAITFVDDQNSGVTYKWTGDDVTIMADSFHGTADVFNNKRSLIFYLVMANVSLIGFYVAWRYLRRRTIDNNDANGTSSNPRKS